MSDGLVGAAVGNYRVVGVLGEGGMGTVYRAVHPELDRTVAIKVVSLALAQSEEIVRRFRVEARAVNKIRHPNVVDVQDFGMLPDGRPYYIMEYLEGESLGHYLERAGALTARDCLSIMLPVAEALEAAHTAGVVHRDLKPDNIFLLARPSGAPVPKLLDFGIAKVLSEAISSGTSQTKSGAVMGTPLYMSPEQASGRVDELGPASDVYSLGVILYQMLAGRPPFEAKGFGELLLMHMQSQPPPLAQFGYVHPALEELVMRMLSKAAAARPADAAAVRRELVRVTAELDVDPGKALTIAPTVRPPAVASAPPPIVKTPSPSAMLGEVAGAAPAGKSRWPVVAAAVAVAGAAIAFVALRRAGDASHTQAAPVVRDAAPVAIDSAAAATTPDAAPAPDAAAPPETELERRLRALKQLHDEKRITDKEYDEQRRRILKDM